MSKYHAQSQTALRLLSLKGQEADLIRCALSGYDPLAPETAMPQILTQCKAQVVNLPASASTISNFDDQILADPALRKSFRFFIMAGLDLTFTPEANDILKTSEGYCRILGSTPLNPAGDGAILYNVGATLDSNISFADIETVVEAEIVI